MPNAKLTPDQRRIEIAAILARSVRRLKQAREQSAQFSSIDTADTPPTCLEVLAETSLTVDGAAGERGREPDRGEI